MELREIKPRELAWWRYLDNDRLLVRVRFVGRDYVSVFVVAATAEQVIASGFGAGEAVNVLPQVLDRVPGGLSAG